MSNFEDGIERVIYGLFFLYIGQLIGSRRQAWKDSELCKRMYDKGIETGRNQANWVHMAKEHLATVTEDDLKDPEYREKVEILKKRIEEFSN